MPPEAAEPQVTPESTPAPETTPSPEPAKPAEKPTLFRGFEDKPEPEKKDDPKPDTKPKPESKSKTDPKLPKTTDSKDKTPESPNIKQLREGHERSQKEWKEKEADYQRRLKEHEDKLKELSSRPERHPDDQKKLSEYEKRIAAADFKNSEEYDKSFRQPLNKAYQDSVSLAARLPVVVHGEDGDTQRAGTEQDFRAVLSAPPEKQAELAHQLYGPANAARVITMIDRISDLYQRGEQEAVKRAEGYNSELKAFREQENQRLQKFSEALSKSRQEVESSLPDIFGDHEDDPEAQKMLTEGREYIEQFRSRRDSMSDAELAETEAVIEVAATAVPLLRYQLHAANQRANSLEKELSKYRESDPGSAGKKPSPEPNPDGEGKGIKEGLLGDWKKFDRR